MAFRGKMHNRIDSIFAEQVIDQCAVANITLNEGVPVFVWQAAQILACAGIGEQIQIDNVDFWFFI